MSIYNINFSQIWETLTPPVLRKAFQLDWGTSLMQPIQYHRDNVLGDYASGSTYDMYSNASAYTTNDRVVYIDRAVYESLSGSTGVLPSDTNSWYKINDNYIGVNERIKYSSRKVLFEYALNRWFQVEDIDTNYWSGANHTNQIYIQNQFFPTTFFLVGETGEYSSTVSEGTSNTYFVGNSYTPNSTISYIIWVPNAVYSGLSSTLLERENIIRSFADEYTLAGVFYSVSGY